MRAVLIAALVLTLASPATAQEDQEDMAPPPSAGGVDAGKLEALQKQLGSQHDSGGQLGKLMRIVTALKNGGKDLTTEDIGMLQEVLAGMAAKNDNPELTSALMMLGPQLEALKRQKANPSGDDDDLKALLDQ